MARVGCPASDGVQTTTNVLIQFLPGGAEQVHIQHLYFNSNVTGGTFKLRVNGNLTAAITFSTTVATLISNINTALDALPNLNAGDIVASGTAVTDITLTGAANGYYYIRVEDDQLTGNSTADPNVTDAVTQCGGEWLTLSDTLNSFSYTATVDTIETQGMSEFAKDVMAVSEDANWDASMYVTKQDWDSYIIQGMTGYLAIYNAGKVVGERYMIMNTLITEASFDYPDHDKMEVSLTGQRKGDWIVPPNSVYA